MIKYAEKRDLLRMPIDCQLSYSHRGGERNYSGHVINLSGKGILFTSSRDIAVGTILEIVLTPSKAETEPMHASVVVARVINNDVLYEIACEIEKIK